MALNRFLGTTDSNWGTATNWSRGTVPANFDGHITRFDATSPNCTLDTIPRFCNVIDFTGYTNTITSTFGLTISGSVTLGANMFFAGASGWIFNNEGIFTSNGTTFGQPLTLSGGNTKQFKDTWILFDSLIILNHQTLNNDLSGAWVIEVPNDLTIIGNTKGSMKLKLTGTGSWSGGGNIGNDLEFDSAGTVTVVGEVGFGAITPNSMSYTSGTVITTGSTLNLLGIDGTGTGSSILDVSAIAWNIIKVGNGNTYTLNSSLQAPTGTLDISIADATFAGVSAFLVDKFTGLANNSTMILVSTLFYSISTSITIWSNGTDTFLFRSSIPTSQAVLTLTAGCIQYLTKVNATDIDSSFGDPVETYRGVLVNATNWTVC